MMENQKMIPLGQWRNLKVGSNISACECRLLIDSGELAGAKVNGKYYVEQGVRPRSMSDNLRIKLGLSALKKDKPPSPQPDYDTLPKAEKRMYKTAKRNALKRGIDFSLTRKRYGRLMALSNGRCQLTGIEFDIMPPQQKGARRPFAASIDRIDSSKGYTHKNVRIVCIIVNLAMNEWGEEPLRVMAAALLKKSQ